MILAKTQKIMNTGIVKYSRIYKVGEEETQILIKADDEDGVIYKMCNNWKPKDVVSFKDIMDVRIDLLGFEMLSAPFLRKSVDMYAKNYNSELEHINLFIIKKNSKIMIAVYKETEFKEVLTLEKQFERLGL
jgi:hypothetical protein